MDTRKVIDGIKCGSLVKVIAASRASYDPVDVLLFRNDLEGNDLFTLQMEYWRPIHSEIMTHGMKSISASSSRAIPVNKILQEIRDTPWGPLVWGKNQPGMQAYEFLEGNKLDTAKIIWRTAARDATEAVTSLIDPIGLHKQATNRLTEPFQSIKCVFTATRKSLQEILRLRNHHAAQPEFRELAQNIQHELDNAVLTILKPGEWHLPYVTDIEKETFPIADLLVMSTARCCRVSYNKHDGSQSTLDEDRATWVKLHIDDDTDEEPAHRSPAEHQAKCLSAAQINHNHLEVISTMNGRLGASTWWQHRRMYDTIGEIKKEHQRVLAHYVGSDKTVTDFWQETVDETTKRIHAEMQ